MTPRFSGTTLLLCFVGSAKTEAFSVTAAGGEPCGFQAINPRIDLRFPPDTRGGRPIVRAASPPGADRSAVFYFEIISRVIRLE